MAAPVETFTENDMTGAVGNSHNHKRGHGEDSGAGASEKRWPGWPGESVFRILVPANKVGAIIGRKGESIKRMCDESKARIKILNCPPGAPERAVMVSAKEDQDASISPAMDGLLRVHKCIVDGLDGESAHAPPKAGGSSSTRLLVAATQAASLIGKQGSTIKSIQEASNSAVRVLDDLPPFALQDDRIVEIQGEPSGMHKAVELIASHLRKFLVDRSVLPLFDVHMSGPHALMEQNMPPPQPWGHPQNFPPSAGGPVFDGNPQFMPPRSHDNFYPPPEHPPFGNQPHHGIHAYGQDAPPAAVHPLANQHSQPHGTQVTHHMQIPLSYADAVIGKAGANISYVRRASGATVTIQETRGVPGEMTVEVNGSAAQVQTAQQLIQNFMAGAAAPPQNTTGHVDQSYNQYPAHSSMYASHPANAGNSYPTQGPMYAAPPVNAGHAGPAGGGYGSGYGGNYGY